MTPAQENALLKLVANDLKHPLFAYVNDLIAQARADERERVIAAMSEYLPADSRAKIAAAIRARKEQA